MTFGELFSYFLECRNYQLNLIEYPKFVFFLYNGNILNFYPYSQKRIEDIIIHDGEKIIVIDFENYLQNFSEFIYDKPGLEFNKEIEFVISEIKKNNRLDQYLNDAIKEIVNPSPKMNMIFRHTQGSTLSIIVNYGTTIDQLLKIYLKRMNKINLYFSENVCFLFNASRLKLGDKTSVEDYFKYIPNPSIIVNEIGPYDIDLERMAMHSHFEELYRKYKLFLDTQLELPKLETSESH